MNRRELVGIAMVILAIGLAPFARGASVTFGLFALGTGLAGLILFVTARPRRSRDVDAHPSDTHRLPSVRSLHDAQSALPFLLNPDGGSDGGAGHGGGDGGGGNGGH
jgi:hypothetical protein